MSTFFSPAKDTLADSARYIADRLAGFQRSSLPADAVSDLLERAYHLLQYSTEDGHQNLGLAVICHVAENLEQDGMVRALLFDCISACSNFLYSDMLAARYGKDWLSLEVSVFDSFRREFYRSDTDALLTRQQHQLLRTYKENPRLVVSAPTSFGKTRLLQEIILGNDYKRIALVMPTIALIAETVRRIRTDQRFAHYPVINSASLPVDGERFILVLTPEKLDLVLEANESVRFDFFAMDEIYKIQDDDDRKAVFANVLYRLATSGADFYLIGPYFKRFSPRFLARTRSVFQHYALEIVQKDEIHLQDIPAGEVFYVDGAPIKKAVTEITNLKRIVTALKDQRLIYNSTKRGTETIAKQLRDAATRPVESDLISYVKENISDEWSLVSCLEKGVAFHHGAMPRYIQAELVDSFNRGDIDTLVCTTTLTEGVNTTAKNVIVFSDRKGIAELTGFDYKNIKGRAGRFLHHFVGRVFTFHRVKEEERDLISFHYLDNEELESDEVLYVDETDLLPKTKAKRNRVIELLREVNVPLETIRKNKYIAVEKQLSLVKRLRRDGGLMRDLLFYGNIPESGKLEQILEIAREYLFNKSDYEDRNFSSGDLTRLTKFYVYKKPPLKAFIATQNGKSADTRIRRAFNVISHYFEFALPKYLSCMQSLYNFVADTSGLETLRLNFVITMLQYGFTAPHEIALKDAGVPDEIINKITGRLSECRSLEEIRLRIRIAPETLEVLSDFERNLLVKVV